MIVAHAGGPPWRTRRPSAERSEGHDARNEKKRREEWHLWIIFPQLYKEVENVGFWSTP
jgi:hypothetical protein